MDLYNYITWLSGSYYELFGKAFQKIVQLHLLAFFYFYFLLSEDAAVCRERVID